MVTLNFELTKEDYFQFYYYASWIEAGKKSAAYKSRLRNFLLCAAGLFFVKMTVSKYSFDIFFFYTLFVLATIFVFPLFYMKDHLRKQAYLFSLNPLNQNLFSNTEISFAETGIFGKNNLVDVSYKWASIVKKAETAEHYFLYISATQALIIPKRVIKFEPYRSRLIELFDNHIPFNAEIEHLIKD